MSHLTDKEIEQLHQQLKEKMAELRAIYDKLVQAGVVPLADDCLDVVAGGCVPDLTMCPDDPMCQPMDEDIVQP